MQISRKRGLYESARIVYLKADEITPNPGQPRSSFEPGPMRELAESISRYGILQPLSVRRCDTGYELVSGERRLRAAKLAGLHDVPCVILDVDSPESAVLALVENLQRRDLSFIEEAEGLSRLVHVHGYSQEKVARLVGRSQPAVANKLRLLKLPRELLEIIRDAALTERHARALLRIKDEALLAPTLGHIITHSLTVAETDLYIDTLLAQEAEQQEAARQDMPTPRPESEGERGSKRPVIVVNDSRFFLNTVTRGMEVMQRSGIPAKCDRAESDDEIVLTIRVPKSGRRTLIK